MKFEKRSGYEETTLRRVWSDDYEVNFGVVGTVKDMIDANVLDWCEMSHDLWLYLPALGIIKKSHFGKTREEALEEIEYISAADAAIKERAELEAKYDRFIDGEET